eukprot:contig_22205_g5490
MLLCVFYDSLFGDVFSSVVQRLETVRLPDVSVQYSEHQLSDPQLQLRGSGDIVQELQRCAVENLAPAAGRPKVLVVSGPAGSGKTRVRFEALCRPSGLSGDLKGKLEQSAGCAVVTIPLFIDFNNGFSYLDGVDGGNIDQNLGMYMQRLMTRSGYSEEQVRLCFKDMMGAANNWVSSASVAVGSKLVFFPVVTGTPVAGLKLLLTDKLSQVAVTPDRLLLVESAELIADVLTAHPERSPLRPGVLEALLGSDQARNALGDTDFLPRHIVNLGNEALKVFPPATDGAAMASGIDWALAMGPVVLSTVPEDEVRNASTLALLALSQAPVDLDGTSLPFAQDVTAAAVSGVVKLVS